MQTITSDMAATGAAFLAYVDDWFAGLSSVDVGTLVADAGGPEHVGIFCVDVINGFCHTGALQSDRVRAIIAPIVGLLGRAHGAGVRRFVMTQDCHPADAVEFKDFPPHCIEGTEEAQMVPEIAGLSFANLFTVLPKRSLASDVATDLDRWLEAHPEISYRIVVGDCTDLCTYQLAMHLKLSANAANRAYPVIVPADCVDTYDLPLDVARALSIHAHPAEVFHRLFLYHMALNGVRVVRSLS